MGGGKGGWGVGREMGGWLGERAGMDWMQLVDHGESKEAMASIFMSSMVFVRCLECDQGIRQDSGIHFSCMSLRIVG